MIILLGYMGCGKSSVSEYLFQNHNLSYCDLDDYIEKKENKTISSIFQKRGEIYFRKVEHQYLKQIINQNTLDILALGGGTPCYSNNMEIIEKQKIKSIYLKVDLETLTNRLFSQKFQRPLIADINSKKELKDFIRKHLFEREFYYRKADEVINVSDLSIKMIANRVLSHLN